MTSRKTRSSDAPPVPADLRLFEVRQGEDHYLVGARDRAAVWRVAKERLELRAEAAGRGERVPRCTWPPKLTELDGDSNG